MYYAIACLARDASGNELFVTDAHGKVTGTTEDNKRFTSDQLWLALYHPNNGGVCLKNKETGNLIAVPSGNNPALLVADTVENETKLADPSAVLQIVNSGTNGYMVIRGLEDQDNNLDISGDGPYHSGDQVLFWTWHNDDNYKWAFRAVSA